MVQPGRRRIENNSCPAKAIVQSFVPEQESVLRNLRIQASAATFSIHSAQLENVGKISIEFDCERNIDSCASVVMDSKPLVTRFLPQNLRPEHVHCSSRNYYLAIPPGIGVRGVHRHHRVVFSDGRTEQQRTILSELQRQARQKPSILIVKAEFTGPECLDVTEPVEHSEGIPLFQYPGANIDAGG